MGKNWQQKNVTIATNGLYAKKEKIYPAYVSKWNCEKQVILLMTPNKENWYCLAAKIISVLLWGMTSNNKFDFYCLNCLHSFRIKNLKSHTSNLKQT